MDKTLLSFVIPCYNSEHCIMRVIEEIINTVTTRPQYDYEIICVSDASPDNVYAVLKQAARENARIKAICLAKNAGKHAAMMAGFRFAKGHIIVGLDDDGQCPVDRLFDLVEPLSEGYDASFAFYKNKNQGFLKNVGSRVNNLMGNLILDKPPNIHFSNFFCLNQLVVTEMLRYTNPYPYIEGLVLRATNKIANIPMVDRQRIEGKTGFTFKKSLSLWLNGFTAFSVKPLRLATIIGILSAAGGFIYGAVVVIRKILNPAIAAGYSSQMAALLLIGGLILFTMGLIGEYVGRIYISLNNAPQYIIRSTDNIDNGDKEYEPNNK